MIQVIVLARGGDAHDLTERLGELTDRRSLRCSRPLVFVPGVGRALATMVLGGGDEEVDADLAVHLEALRTLSRAQPDLRLGIELRPDGGTLILSAGVFDDEDAVAALIAVAPTSAGAACVLELRVMAPPELHAEVLGEIGGAIARSLPNQPTPRIVTTMASVEMAFDVVDRERLARLVSEVGFAWRQPPWPAQTWATLRVPGAEPLMRAVLGREDWQELELAAREANADETTTSTQIVDPATPEIAWHPQVIDLLREDELHWIDRTGRALVLGREGRLCVRSGHRILMRGEYEFVQDASGAGGVQGIGSTSRRSMPDPPAGWTRRAHHLTAKGTTVVTDDRPDGRNVISRVWVDAREGPLFRSVTALAVCDTSMEVFLSGEHRGTNALITLNMGSLAWTARSAWGPPWTAVDLGVRSLQEVVAICVDGVRARVVVIGIAYADERMVVELPCAAPRMVRVGRDQVWLVGTRQGDGGLRDDLYEVELASGSITIRTGGLAASGWGRLEASSPDGARWLIHYENRGVFVAQAGQPIELVQPLSGQPTLAALSFGGSVACTTGDPANLHLIAGRDLRVSLSLGDASPVSALSWWPAGWGQNAAD